MSGDVKHPGETPTLAQIGDVFARYSNFTLGGGSAGLFKGERVDEATAPRELAAFPQLARPLYWQVLRPALAATTREALDAAASPQDWNALYLSAPEFMFA